MKEAVLYERIEDGKVKCLLCNHYCVISPGRRGICGVRENRNGTLYSLVYGKLISANDDPIEKKPLFHFLPGSRSFSIATVGCNLKCRHCQNYVISQYPHTHKGGIPGEDAEPEDVVNSALRLGCASISYTYTEPTVFFEFALDCAKLAHKKGIKNVFVSNGYMSPQAIEEITPYLDGNNIDLKGDDEFYKKICRARLNPVLETIRRMKEAGVWIEITTLLIPSYNDSEEILRMIIDFILSIDPAIPWHVTQFYPTYEMLDKPRTPVDKLRKARDLGLSMGLKYVYVGNVPGEGGENTYCPNCKELLIERVGYSIFKNRIKDGKCFNCNSKIEGIWG